MMGHKRKPTEEVEEADFETFVRDSLSSMCRDIEEIRKGQKQFRELHKDVAILKARVTENDKVISGIHGLVESIGLKYDKLCGDVFHYQNKIDKLKKEHVGLAVLQIVSFDSAKRETGASSMTGFVKNINKLPTFYFLYPLGENICIKNSAKSKKYESKALF